MSVRYNEAAAAGAARESRPGWMKRLPKKPDTMGRYTVDFQPMGRRGQCRDDQSLLDCARELGVGISSICGGAGTCRGCRVRLSSGAASAATAQEREAFSLQEIDAGWRLACQVYPASDCTVTVPAESMTAPQRTQVEGLAVAVPVEPAVRSYRLNLDEPSLADLRADADRLVDALEGQHQQRCDRLDLALLQSLSPRLRSWGWECQAAVRHREVIAVGPSPGRFLGLAVDLGTTKIAGYLVDLSDGRTLAARGTMNPQIELGEDVVTRIGQATGSPDGAAKLQRLAVEAINQLASDLCGQVGAAPEEIIEAAVVGNTALHHFLLGLPVAQLVVAPFSPAVCRALDVKARDLGLHIAPGAYVHLLPNIAGFVGADHVATLLATGVASQPGPVVALDIGTNTEVSLAHQGRVSSVSCASGPAFEGGHIKDGMRAAAGAIERLRIEEGRARYQTVDGAPPAGLCGSGILDAVAELLRAGIINEGGRMAEEHPLVREDGGQRHFVIVSEEERESRKAIAITQRDVRELQLAKAAIRTGIQALLENGGCQEEDIRQVVIAGAFGSYIDVSSAMAIGMLPFLPLERFRQVGNAAGTGARLALVSVAQRSEAQRLASRVQYIELAATPHFMKTFTEATYLGRYRLRKGTRESIG